MNESFQPDIAKKPQGKSWLKGISSAGSVQKTMTVRRSPEEIYNFLRDFSNFPKFMKEIAEIKVSSPTLSHWRVKLEYLPDAEWEVKIVEDRARELISWSSLKDSIVAQSGVVYLKPSPKAHFGTEVTYSIEYAIPGGKAVELITKLVGEDPDTLVIRTLRALRAYLETGEVPTIEGQSSGRDKDYRETERHLN